VRLTVLLLFSGFVLFDALLPSSMTAAKALPPQPVKTKSADIDLLAALALPKATAYAFDPAIGFVVGDEGAITLIEKNGISLLVPVKGGAQRESTEAPSTFRVLPPDALTAHFLKTNFANTYGASEAEPVIRALLRARPLGILFSPGKGRAIYVRTADGSLYYMDQSPIDAPTFTRLVPMAMPKLIPAKKADPKATDIYINALPPCSEGKFPCKN
jgi:hypothetical protein